VSDNLVETPAGCKTGRIAVMTILLACLMWLLFNVKQSYNKCSLQEDTFVLDLKNLSGWVLSVPALVPIVNDGFETKYNSNLSQGKERLE
jgi:hypothetical protein